MNKLQLVKTVTTTIVGLCTSATVGQVLRNTMQPQNTKEIIQGSIAAAAIGGMVAEQARNYTDRSIDEVVKTIDKIKGNN